MNVSYVPWSLAHGARIYARAASSAWSSSMVARGVGRARTGERPRSEGEGGSGWRCMRAAASRRREHRANAEHPAKERPSSAGPRRAFPVSSRFRRSRRFRRPGRDGVRRDAGGGVMSLAPDRPHQARNAVDSSRARRGAHPGIGHELMDRFGAFRTWRCGRWWSAPRLAAPCKRGGGAETDRACPRVRTCERARKGLALLARMMFEAGAREVWPGLFGVPACSGRSTKCVSSTAPRPTRAPTASSRRTSSVPRGWASTRGRAWWPGLPNA